jgi:AraC-like DNA-binding protein
LQDEGTSFQRVLDEFRTDLAREYLGAGMMPAKEVAYLLGFSQVDAFRRAFKAWTGQTVGHFQSAGGLPMTEPEGVNAPTPAPRRSTHIQ